MKTFLRPLSPEKLIQTINEKFAAIDEYIANAQKRKSILIVDDDATYTHTIEYRLQKEYNVYTANSAMNAIAFLGNCHIDLLLLDYEMPVISGLDLFHLLKNEPKTANIPVIFLTAKDTEDDTLQGFGLGADDYVTKPFSVREVLARVKAVLSRVNQGPVPLIYEGLSLDTVSKTATVDGAEVSLTRTEFDLLRLLLSHRGEVFSRQQLLEQVWPSDVIVTDRTVDVNITRLRKKIGQYAGCIVARQGFGYCFVVISDK